MNRNHVINVVKPGPVSVGRVDIGGRAKLMLYQLHDLNPKCTIAELPLHLDMPQSQIMPVLKILAVNGYAVRKGSLIEIHDTPQGTPEEQPKVVNVEHEEACMEMAEALTPKISDAYHVTGWNKYQVKFALLQIVQKLGVDVEILRRACRWMGDHVTDPYFPILHSPICLYSKWGYIKRYKRRCDADAVKSRAIL